MIYDYLIIGSGFFGSICARELTDAGYKCLVIENRPHIGGNCYTEKSDGIHIHKELSRLGWSANGNIDRVKVV
jgi:UDP-galactopyranose mutase